MIPYSNSSTLVSERRFEFIFPSFISDLKIFNYKILLPDFFWVLLVVIFVPEGILDYTRKVVGPMAV